MPRIPDKFKVQHHRRGALPTSEVFVLVPRRDPAAVAAILAYAAATSDTELASSLHAWATEIDPQHPPATRPPTHTLSLWVATLATEVREGRMDIETAMQRVAGHALRYAERARGEAP